MLDVPLEGLTCTSVTVRPAKYRAPQRIKAVQLVVHRESEESLLWTQSNEAEVLARVERLPFEVGGRPVQGVVSGVFQGEDYGGTQV